MIFCHSRFVDEPVFLDLVVMLQIQGVPIKTLPFKRPHFQVYNKHYAHYVYIISKVQLTSFLKQETSLNSVINWLSYGYFNKRTVFLFFFHGQAVLRTLLTLGYSNLAVRFSTCLGLNWEKKTGILLGFQVILIEQKFSILWNQAKLIVCFHFSHSGKNKIPDEFISFSALVRLKLFVCNRLCFCDYSFPFFINKDRN